MAAISGITGAVTSWSGTTNAYLAATGVEPAQFNLTLEGTELDTTSFTDAGVGTAIKGLAGWFAEWETWLKAPAEGSAGLVTYTAGYTANLNAWELEAEADEFESTAFGGTVKAYTPGGFKWRGSFSGHLDDTTAAVAVGNSNEPATGTFKYQEKGATDNTLSGSIFTHGANLAVAPSALNAIAYNFRGSGALTQSTPSAGVGIIPNGVLPVPTAGSLVLTASSGRTYTGSAFWTRIGISCRVNELVRVRVRARGTGALTIA